MDIDRLLHLATRAGSIMLSSGGETYRVEETINRICLSYGVDYADSFVTPTGIVVSVSKDYKTYSLVKRVKVRGTNLNKIELINNLSRKITTKPLSFEEIEDELVQIESTNRYSMATTIFFSGLAGGAFTTLFNGNFRDIISAFLIGGLIKYLGITFSKMGINEFFINSICAAIASLLAIIFFKLGLILGVDETIIGSIMLLVPGLSITNAIRDTIAGDFLSGITKGFEAFLIAVSIACGTGAVLSVWLNYFGGSL